MAYTRRQVCEGVEYYVDRREIKNIVQKVEDDENLINDFILGITDVIWPTMNKVLNIFNNKAEIASKREFTRKLVGVCLRDVGIKGKSSKMSAGDVLEEAIEKVVRLHANGEMEGLEACHNQLLNILNEAVRTAIMDPDQEID